MFVCPLPEPQRLADKRTKESIVSWVLCENGSHFRNCLCAWKDSAFTELGYQWADRGKNRAARVRERAKIPLGFSRADARDSARVHGKQSHFQTEGWVQVRHLTGRCTSQELHLQRWGSRSCLHLCDSRELDLPHISSMRGHSRLPMCRAHWASGLLQLYHMLPVGREPWSHWAGKPSSGRLELSGPE